MCLGGFRGRDPVTKCSDQNSVCRHMASLREGGAEACGEGWDVPTRLTSIHSMGSGGDTSFSKGGVCSSYTGITLSLPWEGLRQGTAEDHAPNSWILDSRGKLWISSWSWKAGLALYPLHRAVEGSWEFAKSVNMCFVYLEKAFSHEVLRKYGPLLRAVRPEQVFGSHGTCWTQAGLPFVTNFDQNIYEILGIEKGYR